jgi:hypothetical protein
MQRVAVAVLDPPRGDGGPPKYKDDLFGDGGGREEWEDRKPVDFDEVPHGNIQEFIDLISKKEARIHTFSRP